jgi:hypothetical protein
VWGRRDPVGMYEEYLADIGRPLSSATDQSADPGIDAGEWNRSVMQEIEKQTLQEVDEAEREALRSLDTSVPRAGPDEVMECYG